MRNGVVFISVGSVEYSCPHCGAMHADRNDALSERISRNKNRATRTHCANPECGERFMVTSNYRGDLVAYETTKKPKR